MASAVLCLVAPAFADPIGSWLTEGGNSRVRIVNCSGALCGNIEWLKQPNDPGTGKPKLDRSNADPAKRSRPLMGVPIVLSMKPNGDKWSGEVYNANDGKTYSGNITEHDPNTLVLQGCVLGGLICKSQIWTRVR
jgi:uncharacterized protein (DUF2147 family)